MGNALTKKKRGVAVVPSETAGSSETSSSSTSSTAASRNEEDDPNGDYGGMLKMTMDPVKPAASAGGRSGQRRGSAPTLSSKDENQEAAAFARIAGLGEAAANMAFLKNDKAYITGKLDSGCTTTIISRNTLDKLTEFEKSHGVQAEDMSVASTGSHGPVYKFADGEAKAADDQVIIASLINDKHCELFANVFEGRRHPFLLGLNFMRDKNIAIRFGKEHDTIWCPSLGFSTPTNLPRERPNGLSVIPFAVDYHQILADLDAKVMAEQRRINSEKKFTGE